MDNNNREEEIKKLLRIGSTRYRRMLETAGGAYTGPEAMELLGITRDRLQHLVETKQIITVSDDSHALHPVWQFDTESKRIHSTIPTVLEALHPTSEVSTVRFFLTPDKSLSGPPIQAIRENRDIDAVLRCAARFGHHGAI